MQWQLIFFQFQHIYAIGLKERTDKRDFLTVAASVTGFKVEWLDGVLSKDLQQKSLPKVCIQSRVYKTYVAGADLQYRDTTLLLSSLRLLDVGELI